MSNELIEIIRSSDGVIRTPYIHDGYMMGMVILSNSSIALYMRGVDEIKYRVTLLGVERFVADQFWEGNIIFDMSLIETDQVKPKYIAYLHHGGSDLQREETINKLYTRLRQEGLKFFEITPSMGCYIAAVVKDITIEKVTEFPGS